MMGGNGDRLERPMLFSSILKNAETVGCSLMLFAASFMTELEGTVNVPLRSW